MLPKLLGFLAIFYCVSAQLISIEKDDLSLTIDESLKLVLSKDGEEKLSASLGINVNVEDVAECAGVSDCLQFDNVRLHITSNIENGFKILWTTTDTSINFRDCYNLNSEDTNWFGGPERYDQYWPIEKLTLTDFANVPQEDQWGAFVEPYWLNSRGAYIFIDDKVPLFIDQNSYIDDAVCFSARVDAPYRVARTRVLLSYTIVATEDAREGHIHAIEHFLGKPTGHPANWIVENPIWSSWARYKTEINDDILLEFANEILDNGYTGQFEIDDLWETCYGSLIFRDPEFSNITSTVQTVKDMGFTVALWTHPFINLDCVEWAEIARNNEFLVKNEEGSFLTQWWQSLTGMAHLIDFTNEEARTWFISRLQRLKDEHGIDTFKFDAGETSWAPQSAVIYGDIEESPSKMTSDYVRACATFGDHIEVRTGWRSQDLPVFVRMIDKDSRWGLNNGLKSLVTTLLQMNINGYPMVLPDMIGGNGYEGESPTAEMFVRWLQANTFMPSIQFSFVPWDYDDETIDTLGLSQKFVELHALYSEEIIRAMEKAISDGHPINAPLWWIDPTDPNSLKEDSQYLLGEDIVVAPVLDEGAVSRDVYLPSGTWIDGNTGEIYEGNQVLEDYDAPIEILPYFIRESSDAARVHIRSKIMRKSS